MRSISSTIKCPQKRFQSPNGVQIALYNRKAAENRTGFQSPNGVQIAFTMQHLKMIAEKVSITKRCTDCSPILIKQTKRTWSMFQSPNGVQIALAVWETLRKSEEEFQSPNGVQIAFGESLNGYINRLFQSPNGVQIAFAYMDNFAYVSAVSITKRCTD